MSQEPHHKMGAQRRGCSVSPSSVYPGSGAGPCARMIILVAPNAESGESGEQGTNHKLSIEYKRYALPRAAGSLDPIVHVLVPISTQEGQRGRLGLMRCLDIY